MCVQLVGCEVLYYIIVVLSLLRRGLAEAASEQEADSQRDHQGGGGRCTKSRFRLVGKTGASPRLSAKGYQAHGDGWGMESATGKNIFVRCTRLCQCEEHLNGFVGRS